MDDEAAVAGRDRGEVDLGREARGLAEHHVAVARTFRACCRGRRQSRPDDEVVEAVAVDVAGRGYPNAGYIGGVLAVDDEAAVAGRDRGEVDLRREARRLAEHHVAVAGTVARVAGAIGTGCPDDEVVEAVAVDVAGRGHRMAGLIAHILAMEDEAAVAGCDRGEVDLRRKARGLAEHHVAVAGIVAGVAGAIRAGAPMMRSSKPSPLMSPADDTDAPE